MTTETETAEQAQGKKRTHLTARIPVDLDAAISRAATANYCTRTTIVHQALASFLKPYMTQEGRLAGGIEADGI